VSAKDPDDRLSDLERRIAAMKEKDAPRPHQDSHHSQAQLAWRMVIELVAGLLIGLGIGIGLDALFGTRPVFLVIFTLLGIAAGIKTMMRSADEIQQRVENADADGTDKGTTRDGE